MLHRRACLLLIALGCGPGAPNVGDTSSAGSSGGVATTGGLAGDTTTGGTMLTSSGSLPTTSGASTTDAPGDVTSTTVSDPIDTTAATSTTSSTTDPAVSTSSTTDVASSTSDAVRIDFDCMTGSDDSTTADPQPCACTPEKSETPSCGDQLCDTAVSDEFYVLANPDALLCALEALRDRTPGYVKWAWNEGGMHSSLGYVLILPDHTAIYRVWGTWDADFSVPPEHVLLADPCVFEQCLDGPSFNCLAELPRTHLDYCR